MTTNNTDMLTERIRRARSVPAEWSRLREGESTREQMERHQRRMDEQTAALVAEEVRKAKAEAWGNCELSLHRWFNDSFAGDEPPRNPYGVIERKETAMSADEYVPSDNDLYEQIAKRRYEYDYTSPWEHLAPTPRRLLTQAARNTMEPIIARVRRETVEEVIQELQRTGMTDASSYIIGYRDRKFHER